MTRRGEAGAWLVLLLLAAVVVLCLAEGVAGCTVVRFEEEVHSRTLRWGVLTKQKVGDFSEASSASHGYEVARSGEERTRAAHEGAPRSERLATLQVAAIRGSERYKDTKSFFEDGGSDEAHALCILLNEEAENRLARSYGSWSGTPSDTAGALAATSSGRVIVELLDAADVILKSPISIEGGGEVLYYPTDGNAERSYAAASGAKLLEGSSRSRYERLAKSSISNPFSSVDEQHRDEVLEVTPTVGLVMAKRMEKSGGHTSKGVKAAIGGVVMGSVFSTLAGRRSDVALGPYMHLAPAAAIDRRLLDDLRCRLWVDNVLKTQFRFSPAVSKQALEMVREMASDSSLTAGSVALFQIPSSAQSSLNGISSILSHLPDMFARFLGAGGTESGKVTAGRGSVVKTALCTPNKLVDLGVQANEVVPRTGGTSEFADWATIVAYDPAVASRLDTSITFFSRNWLWAIVVALSLVVALVLRRLLLA